VRKADDWEKPRSKGQHLTEAEIATIKQDYLAGRHYRDVAKDLKCSSRIVSKYYGLFRAEGAVQNPKRPPVAQNRFYKSDFSL
jgi:transposase